MRILANNEVATIGGGDAYAFCVIEPNGVLMCTQVAWNGFEYVQIGQAQVLPITYVDGAATFFI